jgi:hypothetical protein
MKSFFLCRDEWSNGRGLLWLQTILCFFVVRRAYAGSLLPTLCLLIVMTIVMTPPAVLLSHRRTGTAPPLSPIQEVRAWMVVALVPIASILSAGFYPMLR